MFETYKEAELDIPKLFPEDENQVWDYIFRRLHSYWFHVVVSPREGVSERGDKIFFLRNIESLQVFELDNSSFISELTIVTPGWMNGTGQWSMDPLDKILAGYEPNIEQKQLAFVFVLKNGESYIDSSIGTKEPDLLNRFIVFEI